MRRLAVAAALLVPLAAAAHAVGPLPERPGFVHFLVLGVGHVLSGFDHLAFLAGLMLVAPGLGGLARSVTAFTLAHSVTLALAVTGLVAIPSALVEPAIAASVVLVAVDAAVDPRPRGRAAVAFGFGLVHGLGFAGALREHGLEGARLAPALAGFNVGVEAGQLAIVLAFAPLLLALRRRDPLARVAVPAASAAVGGVGVYFLVLRLLA